MRRDWLLGSLLAALTLAVYWPVRTHDFVAYDDPEFITENSQIQSGLSWSSVVYAFTRAVAGNWHPVTTLSHALDCELFRLNPGPPHLVNAAIHSVNAAVLFLLLRRLTRTRSVRTMVVEDGGIGAACPARTEWLGQNWACFFVACIFAFHPLRVESVAWLAERKDLLTGFFFLLSVWMYACYAGDLAARQNHAPGVNVTSGGARWPNRPRLFYLGSLLCYAFGLMSKPMVVTLPFVLLLLDYWPLQRFKISDLRSQLSTFRVLFFEKVPFLALSILDCWITLSVQRSAGATRVIQGITWAERLGNAATSYVRYLGKLFWPADLAIVYPHPAKHYHLTDQWPAWEINLAVLLLIMLCVYCLVELRKRPYLAVSLFWFLGMLVPVIGIIQVGEQAMADRYSYLPLIGFVIGCVFWTDEAVVPATVGLKQLFGALPWRTDKQLATSPPVRPRTEHPEGGGDTLKNWSGIALGCLILVTLICLTRRQLGYWRNTVTLFEHAIAVTADNPSAQFAMGVGLEREGEVRKAAVHYRVAVAIDPNYSKAYYNLGQILRKTGQWQQAADAYLAAVRLNPSDLATHLNLASVLAHLGRTGEAVLHFNEALRMDPASIEALNNLAWLLATYPTPGVRDGARAVELAERACSLTDSRAAILLGTLAAAYAEAGRFLDAVATAQRACAQATATGDSDTATKNHELLQLYLANRPYRCAP